MDISFAHRLFAGLFFLFPITIAVQGQESSFSLEVQPTTESMVIDGVLDEPVWQSAKKIDHFFQYFPANESPAENPTEVYLTFDDRFLYIAAHCYQNTEKGFTAHSLKRDFNFTENDAFEIYIDAFGDATSGLVFGVNPFGVQKDGIIPDGGNKPIDLTWNGQWFSEVNRQVDGWTLEIAIPFKSLRFNPESTEWRINFARNNIRQNEISTWTSIPRGFRISTLSMTGHLHWSTALPDVKNNMAIIPYLGIKNYKESSPKNIHKTTPLGGIDAQVGINTSLHLDLTVNPDFSQAEVDEQVINLNRFELYFPEKRVFFLENSDLFSSLGNTRLRPFFSRRIGSLNDDSAPINFGARLSGKLNKDYKIGLMNLQTRGTVANQTLSQNYLVATIQRSIFSGSNVTAFLTNRQAMHDFELVPDNFSRVGGLEMDYRSADSKVSGKAFVHRAFSSEGSGHPVAYSAKARYKTKTFSVFMGVDAAGKDYLTDMGFVPKLYHSDEVQDTSYRVSFAEYRSNVYYRWFLPKNSVIDYVGGEMRLGLYVAPDFSDQEHSAEWGLSLNFVNQNQLSITYTDYSQALFYPFTLNGLDQPFPAQRYANRKYDLEFNTGNLNALNGSTRLSYGGTFMGQKLSILSELNYRYRQYLVLGLNHAYQELSGFPEQYGSAKFTLVGSKVEVSFNREVFLTTYLQYNTQHQNFNVNTRLNWNFRPLSDLFIVYTSNYFTEDYSSKNHALVIKLNYWLNL